MHTAKHYSIDCNKLDTASEELGMLSLGQKHLCQEKYLKTLQKGEKTDH